MNADLLLQHNDQATGNPFPFPGPFAKAQPLPATAEEDRVQSDGEDSDRFSTNSSFLVNEKLMSMDSMNSDITGLSVLDLKINDF